MTQLFNRWLPAVTLAAWGAVALYAGSHSEYLAVSFARYATIAGVVLLVASVVLAVSRPDVACCRDAACSHGLSRSLAGRISTFAVIALPLVLLPFGSKDSLAAIQVKNRKEKQFNHISAETVQNRMAMKLAQKPQVDAPPALQTPLPGYIQPPPDLPLPENPPTGNNSTAATQPPTPASPATPPADAAHPAAAPKVDSFADYFDKSPDGNIIAEVLDLLYAAQDKVLQRDFEGKRVEVVVQYMADSAQKPGAPSRFKGVRMFMQCCTADARPIATLVEMPKLPELPEMSWVKVTGTATFPVEKGQRISVLKAEKVEATEPPADTMLQ